MNNIDRNQPVADTVPWSDSLTPYDEAHLIVYLRILDADAQSACEQEMAKFILNIDPDKEPARAKSVLEQHRTRARWMSAHGYRHLLKDD